MLVDFLLLFAITATALKEEVALLESGPSLRVLRD